MRTLYNLKISYGLEVFPNTHFRRSSAYLLFMAVALILKMHLVRSIKTILKPHWLHRLHNLTPNLPEMGPGRGVILLNHPQCSLLPDSYSLYLLLV